MATRRQVLTGLLATGLATRPTWADAGSPAFLSAAGRPSGSFVLCGLSRALEVLFSIPLAGRGHAAAAHPKRPEAVAFARRPGTFAIVIDCQTGVERTVLQAPEGRHFYGHGTFSKDGSRLYTTENDFENATGRIGVWDANDGYQRLGEMPSGGVGPHDIKRLPKEDTLVVANGGIETHPDSGRSKLNLPMMKPNLSYISAGQIVEQVALSPDLHRNSIRHLAVSRTGNVAFAMQWQGAETDVPLLGLHRRGEATRLAQARPEDWRAMQGYLGSVAFTADESKIAVTSPRGGQVQFYGSSDGALHYQIEMPDACGVATAQDGLAITAGTGDMRLHPGHRTQQQDLSWDNHLIAI